MSRTIIYKGDRYSPQFADPVQWDNKTAYEKLTMVTWNGDTYTSRQDVPAGTALTDDRYWVRTGAFSEQVEQYRGEVAELKTRVNNLEKQVQSLKG